MPRSDHRIPDRKVLFSGWVALAPLFSSAAAPVRDLSSAGSGTESRRLSGGLRGHGDGPDQGLPQGPP